MNHKHQHNPSFYKSPTILDSVCNTISAEENTLLLGFDAMKRTAHSIPISKNSK